MADTSNRPGHAVQLLAGRWTLPVLAELAGGGHRSQDLNDNLEGIAHKALTDTLRKAERDGLITRHLDAEHIETATSTSLADPGRSLDAPLAAFGGTGSRHRRCSCRITASDKRRRRPR